MTTKKQQTIQLINSELERNNLKRIKLNLKIFKGEEYTIRTFTYIGKGYYQLFWGRKRNPISDLNTVTLKELLRQIINQEFITILKLKYSK